MCLIVRGKRQDELNQMCYRVVGESGTQYPPPPKKRDLNNRVERNFLTVKSISPISKKNVELHPCQNLNFKLDKEFIIYFPLAQEEKERKSPCSNASLPSLFSRIKSFPEKGYFSGKSLAIRVHLNITLISFD